MKEDGKVSARRPNPSEHMTEDKGDLLEVERRLFKFYNQVKGSKRLEREAKEKRREGRKK